MHSAPDRVIHISLTEEDWKAFLATQPQPVEWLKQRIQEAIAISRRTPPDTDRQMN